MGKKLMKAKAQPLTTVTAEPSPKTTEELEHTRRVAIRAYPEPAAHDKGPTQFTISRSIKHRFRQACFTAERTMSDIVEGMMEDYATSAGF